MRVNEVASVGPNLASQLCLRFNQLRGAAGLDGSLNHMRAEKAQPPSVNAPSERGPRSSLRPYSTHRLALRGKRLEPPGLGPSVVVVGSEPRVSSCLRLRTAKLVPLDARHKAFVTDSGDQTGRPVLTGHAGVGHSPERRANSVDQRIHRYHPHYASVAHRPSDVLETIS